MNACIARPVATIVLTCVLSIAVVSQPSITLKRTVVNWPKIDLYFSPQCGGTHLDSLPSGSLTFTENGELIPVYSMSCPSVSGDERVSVSLVLDASGSMNGAGNQLAIAGASAFIDEMGAVGGIDDEAAVLWFSDSVTLRLGMTSDKTDLVDAVNSLPVLGATAIWDGILAGIDEVATNGNRTVKAVITLTDGGDNASTHSPEEIIAEARRLGVRVYVISFIATADSSAQMLIADSTGGKYFPRASANTAEIYRTIMAELRHNADECILSFNSTCADGTEHRVSLMLSGVCGGSDTAVTTYTAPYNSSSFDTVLLSAAKKTVYPGQKAMIDISIDSNKEYVFQPFLFRITFDTAVCSFSSVSTAGTACDGVQVQVSSTPGTIDVNVPTVIRIRPRQSVLGFVFQTKIDPGQAKTTSLLLKDWTFSRGCHTPELSDGSLDISIDARPIIEYDSPTTICAGDSVVLRCIDGYSHFRWSTGDTTESVTVRNAGAFWLDAKNIAGQMVRSDTVTVIVLPLPHAVISPGYNIHACEGDTVMLSSLDEFAEYRWSNGERRRSIPATRSGYFQLTVVTEQGCSNVSSAAQITFHPRPDASISGPVDVCNADSVYTYSVAYVPGHQYFWQVAGGVVVTDSAQYSAGIQWRYGTSGTVRVIETEPLSGCSDTAAIDVYFNALYPRLYPGGSVLVCEGKPLDAYVEDGYESYLWNTGHTDRDIRITATGQYSCVVTKNGCSGYTDTLRVVYLNDSNLRITGATNVCLHEMNEYEIEKFPGAKYTWTIHGGRFTHNGGQNRIAVQWDSPGQGNIELVVTIDSCSAAIALPVIVYVYPQPNVMIVGSPNFCVGDSRILYLPDGYTRYEWSTGDTTKGIVVNTSGIYWANITTMSGCVLRTDTMMINVFPAPIKPSIVKDFISDKLRCTVLGVHYQWYLNGVLLPGDTLSTIMPQAEGVYTVVTTTIYGCIAVSDPYVVTHIQMLEQPGSVSLFVSPNPSTGALYVEINTRVPFTAELHCTDLTGRIVYSNRIEQEVGTCMYIIPATAFPRGTYFISVESEGIQVRKAVLIIK